MITFQNPSLSLA